MGQRRRHDRLVRLGDGPWHPALHRVLDRPSAGQRHAARDDLPSLRPVTGRGALRHPDAGCAWSGGRRVDRAAARRAPGRTGRDPAARAVDSFFLAFQKPQHGPAGACTGDARPGRGLPLPGRRAHAVAGRRRATRRARGFVQAPCAARGGAYRPALTAKGAGSGSGKRPGSIAMDRDAGLDPARWHDLRGGRPGSSLRRRHQ